MSSLGKFNFSFLKTGLDDDDDDGSDGSLSFDEHERDTPQTPLNQLLDDDEISFGDSNSNLGGGASGTEISPADGSSGNGGGSKSNSRRNKETSSLFASSPEDDMGSGDGGPNGRGKLNHHDHSGYIAKLKKLDKQAAIKSAPEKENLGQISEVVEADADDHTAIHSNREEHDYLLTEEKNSPSFSTQQAGVAVSAAKVDSSSSSSGELKNHTSIACNKSSGYTDVASLRKKHKKEPKQIQNTLLLKKKYVAQQQWSFMDSAKMNSSENSNPSYNQNIEDLYGDGAGLGSTTQFHNSDKFGDASSAKSYRRFASILPFKQGRGVSAASRASKNDSYQSQVGENESLLMSLEGSTNITDMNSAAAIVRNGMKPQRNFKKGENVLIALPDVISEDIPQEEQNKELRKPTVARVNKYGYPENKSKKEEHKSKKEELKSGPFVYVIATVRKIHFKESARHYTVERADTGAWVRADTGAAFLHHIFN